MMNKLTLSSKLKIKIKIKTNRWGNNDGFVITIVKGRKTMMVHVIIIVVSFLKKIAYFT